MTDLVLFLWAIVLIASVGWALTRQVSGVAAPLPVPVHRVRLTFSAIAFLLVPVAALLAAMFWRESFTDYDASFFTTGPLLGRPIPPPVWPEDGRFWPLGFQEFNLIGRVTESAAGYQVVAAVQLLAFLVAMYAALREFSPPARVAIVSTLLVTPGIAISFAGLVFPERNVLLLLAFLVVALQRWDRQPTPWLLAGLVAVVQAVLYFKEPIFLLLGTFALVRIGLHQRQARARGHAFDPREVRLELAIGALCVVFMLLFAVSQVGGVPMGYATRFQVSMVAALTGYALANLLPYVFLLVVTGRVMRFARGRYEPDRLWDPLAAGASVYILFYFAIGMYRPYYLAPADLIAVVYLARMVRERLAVARPLEGLVLAAGTVLLVFQATGASVMRLVDRKATMIVKEQLADELQRQFRAAPAAGMDLYFPWSTPFVIAEWASYLAWRGLPIETATGDDPSPADGAAVRIWVPAGNGSEACVRWLPFVCHGAANPPRGAIVVSLPDDGRERQRLSARFPAAAPVGAIQSPVWAQRVGRALGTWSVVTTHRGGLPPHWLQGELARVP